MKNEVVNQSLMELAPEVARDWNFEKNGDLVPTKIKARSHKKVWWICSSRHEWQDSPYNRTVKMKRCPYDAGKMFYSQK